MAGLAFIPILLATMGMSSMRNLHAQQAYGYPRPEACILYVNRDFAIDTFSVYSTEWGLIVDGAYNQYRVADDPDECFEVSADLRNHEVARDLINFAGAFLIVFIVLYVSFTVVERVAPGKKKTIYALAIFVFVFSELAAEARVMSIPTLTGLIGGTVDMMTTQQLRDPCSAMVIETDDVFLLNCRDVLPKTDGPDNRHRIEPGQRQ